MRNPLRFFSELLKQPAWVAMWVFVQMASNLFSLVFWDEQLAKIIFVTFLISAALMIGLYSVFGYQKILGAGHILWIPLLIYILVHIGSTTGAFQYYLTGLSLILWVSLLFDIDDVWKYFFSDAASQKD